MNKAKSGMSEIITIILKEYWLYMIFVIIGVFGSALTTVYGSTFLKTLIDDYISPLVKETNPNFTPLANALIKLAVIYGLGVICSYIYVRIMVNVGQGTMRIVRHRLFEHMERLPIKYFDTYAYGDIMSIYTNDTDTLRQFIGQSFPQLLNSVVTIVSVLISMFILNIPLTIFSVLLTVLTLYITGKVAKSSGKYFGEQQANLAKLNAYVEEMMSGQKVIKVFTHEKEAIIDFNKVSEELRDSANKANGYANIIIPIVFQLGNLSYIITALFGAILAVNGYFGLSVGALVAFLTLVKSFNQPFSQMSQQLNSVVMANAGANRIQDLMLEKLEEDEGYVELVYANITENGIEESKERTGDWAWKHYHKEDGTTTYTKLDGNIVMENVDFGYNEEKIVLHNINLFANKGQKVAFVGSTGAGKTTITNLINRFYDINSGKIRYDGINIDKIKKDDLRRSLGVVLQDTHLFTGTIMENIRYGREDATDAECIAAAKLANAHGFIERLPEAYDTIISGDGGKLSQGQRQLLAIARAAVADPPVLILDEATSSIDTRTEVLVQRGMDSLMQGRTTFVIAHRLSTVKNSDCIMVLEQGHIIERGNHDELLAAKGKYYQLYTGNRLSE